MLNELRQGCLALVTHERLKATVASCHRFTAASHCSNLMWCGGEGGEEGCQLSDQQSVAFSGVNDKLIPRKPVDETICYVCLSNLLTTRALVENERQLNERQK